MFANETVTLYSRKLSKVTQDSTIKTPLQGFLSVHAFLNGKSTKTL